MWQSAGARDGCLTYAKLVSYLSSRGFRRDEIVPLAERLVQFMDADHDDLISFPDFLRVSPHVEHTTGCWPTCYLFMIQACDAYVVHIDSHLFPVKIKSNGYAISFAPTPVTLPASLAALSSAPCWSQCYEEFRSQVLLDEQPPSKRRRTGLELQ